MLIVGERINSTRKMISEAISGRDANLIKKEALNQVEAGANYLDVNAGHMEDEESSLKWLVDVVQNVANIPLCLDSASPKVIEAVIPMVEKPPMINSVSLEVSRLEPILSIGAKYKAKLVGLCQSGDTLAKKLDEKVDLAHELVEKADEFNIPLDDLYIDPLIFPVATDQDAAIASLDAIKSIMESFPGVHTICGMTNVSYGLPGRKLVNRIFLAMAISHKLDSVIMDPTDKELYGALVAGEMLVGRDDFCLEYIQAFREGRLSIS